MIKVLFILDPAIVGGATKAFITLIGELKQRQVLPIVCIPNESELAEQLRAENLSVIITHHREMITSRDSGNGFKTAKRRIKQLIKFVWHEIKALHIICHNIDWRSIDIIHTNSSRSDIGFYICMLCHKPHIVHLREFGDADYGVYPLNPLWKHIYNRYANQFICVSEAVKKHWVEKGLNEEKMTIVYDGINESQIDISSQEDKKKESLRLVMSGALHETKGQHIAIKALAYIPPPIKKNIHIDFIGWYSDAYKKVLDELVAETRSKEYVTFLGSRNDVLSLLKNYQIGLMCSRSEGFGLVTAEYMFAQLGVIASDTGSCPELIQNNRTGLLFKCGDPKSLADAIMQYYNHRDGLCQHSSAAREDALKRFTASKNAGSVYQIYNSLLLK